MSGWKKHLKSQKKLATGGLTLPGHPHCGPGNSIGKDTVSELDKACKEHDEGYDKIGPEAYWKFNQPDQVFLDRTRDISGPSAGIVRSIFNTKKLLLPHMPPTKKNWARINKINQARKRPATTAIPRNSTIEQIEEQIEEPEMKRMAISTPSASQNMYDDEDDDELMSLVGEPSNKRRRMGETNGPISSKSGSETKKVPRPTVMSNTAKITAMRKGVLWFYNKAVADANKTFKPWTEWNPSNKADGLTVMPYQGNNAVVHSSIIMRQLKVGGYITNDPGYRWKFYGPLGLITGANRMYPKTSTTSFLTKTSGWDMVKYANWNMELWPCGALSSTENTGRTMPIAYMDVAWDKDTMLYSGKWDYGFQSADHPADQNEEEFPLIANSSLRRYKLGDSHTVIPIKFIQKDKHQVNDGNTHGETVTEYYETPWFDVGIAAEPTSKVMLTQMHVYDESIEKNLRGEEWVCDATAKQSKTENFIAIPYTMSVDIILGYQY